MVGGDIKRLKGGKKGNKERRKGAGVAAHKDKITRRMVSKPEEERKL